MAKTNPQTILLRGRGIREEAPAGGTITPGHLVMLNSSAQLVVHGTAAGAAGACFAVENDLVGKTIDDNYVSGDFVQAEWVPPGSRIYALVAAAATAITAGDLLESAGNGTVRKFGSGVVIGRSLDTLDNSGGGSSARLRMTVF